MIENQPYMECPMEAVEIQEENTPRTDLDYYLLAITSVQENNSAPSITILKTAQQLLKLVPFVRSKSLMRATEKQRDPPKSDQLCTIMHKENTISLLWVQPVYTPAHV